MIMSVPAARVGRLTRPGGRRGRVLRGRCSTSDLPVLDIANHGAFAVASLASVIEPGRGPF